MVRKQGTNQVTTLHTIYRDSFQSLASWVIRRYPHLDAEDIAQSAIVRFWRLYPDCDTGDIPIHRVLLRLTRLAAIDATRKATAKKRGQQFRVDAETIEAPCGQPDQSPLDHIPDVLLPFAHDILAGMTQRELFQVHGEYATRQAVVKLRECLAS